MVMELSLPPTWSVRRPKSVPQHVYDFFGAPLRMLLLPDHSNEQLHLTSLRAERFAAVLPHLSGRVLDVGAGVNTLIKLYQRRDPKSAGESVGLDVMDWGSDCVIVPDCRALPFPDASFDTVTFVACINHIPERREALREARRVLKPNGRLVITMISYLIGTVGHKLWWYSEDKHRNVHVDELMGMNSGDVVALIKDAGFSDVRSSRFLYRVNSLYVATR